MNEKILHGKKNGMAVLLAIFLAYILGIAAVVLSSVSQSSALDGVSCWGLRCSSPRKPWC